MLINCNISRNITEIDCNSLFSIAVYRKYLNIVKRSINTDLNLNLDSLDKPYSSITIYYDNTNVAKLLINNDDDMILEAILILYY